MVSVEQPAAVVVVAQVASASSPYLQNVVQNSCVVADQAYSSVADNYQPTKTRWIADEKSVVSEGPSANQH